MWVLGKPDPMNVVENALRNRNWKYARLDANTILTGVQTVSGRVYFIAIRHEVQRRTVLFLFNPLIRGAADALQALAGGRPPFLRVHTNEGHSSQQVAEICQSLMYMNYQIVLGCFERDDSDGEIRFRIAVPYCDTKLTVAQVDWGIDVAVSTMEVAMPEIERVMDSGRMTV
jgi:hypothetical protein